MRSFRNARRNGSIAETVPTTRPARYLTTAHLSAGTTGGCRQKTVIRHRKTGPNIRAGFLSSLWYHQVLPNAPEGAAFGEPSE